MRPGLQLHSMDVASAYPHAMTRLPSLAGGRWDRIENGVRYKTLAELKAIIEASSVVSMFYLDYQFSLYEHFDGDVWKRIDIPWYPLFFRSRRGAIYYPRRGKIGTCATMRSPLSIGLNGSRRSRNGEMTELR
jgi:hypothetical protein